MKTSADSLAMMTMGKSKKKPVIPVVSPSIPKEVDVSDDNVRNSLLRYGSSTPGKMATAARVVSPMAVFQGDGRYFKEQASQDRSFEDDNESFVADRLGIKKPAYYRDDSSRQTSASSHRIGITRPSYEMPDLPISPLDIYLEKKAVSPTPNLVELDSTEDSADAVPAWLLSKRILKVPSRDETETVDVIEDDDSIERMVHNPTAEGHYLVTSKPVTAPQAEIKYSLEKGLDNMPLKMIRASKSHMKRPPRPPPERLQSSPARLGVPDASFKVFLLLLNPDAKIFELIQVIYAPSITTLGDILARIPANSTEPALGSQSYTGLCRPKDGIEMTDMRLMASGSHSKMSCARIMRGEILVAISSGYTGEQCSKFAIPILKNQRVLKLLTRSDPLAASRKYKKRRSSRTSSTDTPHRPRRHSTPVRGETIKEEPEFENSPCSTQDIDQAMKHALEAAALTNALLPDTPDKTICRNNSSVDSPADRWTTTNNFDHSASNSVSSAASYESMFASGLNSKFSFQSTSKRLPRRSVTRRKHRRSKCVTYLWRVTMLSVIFMVGRFMTDADAPRDRDDFTKILGWMGLFQFMVVFVVILKIHRYALGNHDADAKCPFVRASVIAASSVLERIPTLQEKYA